MEALDFVQGLWSGGIPPGHFLTLWHRPARRSEWYSDMDRLAADAARMAERSDVYLGGATVQGTPLPPTAAVRITQRAHYTSGAKAGQPGQPAAAVHGVWLDLDYDHPKHRKPGLPSFDAVHELTKRGGPSAPTYVVHSGHGFQLWWAFHQPWLLTTDADRVEVERIMAAIRDAISQQLGGATIDSTHDVSRVMRLPGTLNHGDPDEVVPVSLMDVSGPRYDPDDLRALFPTIEQPPLRESGVLPPSTAGERDGGSTPEPRRRPPAQVDAFPAGKHAALLANHEIYAQAWQHKRRLRDQSISGYDMSLVRIAANAGWSDTELEALIIRHRSEHGDPQTKRVRRDYMDRTIRRAREQASAYAAADDEDPGGDLLADLERHLGGTPVIVCHPGDQPTYWLRVGDSEVLLGDANGILQFPRFKRAVADGARRVLPKGLAKVWDGYAQALLDTVEDVEIGPEARRVERIEERIERYLDARGIDDERDADRIAAGLPVHQGRYVSISLSDVSLWLRDDGERQVERTQVAAALRMAGWESHALSYTKRSGHQTTRNSFRRAVD